MFKRQNKESKEHLVAIPAEEYAELIECKTRLNVVHDFITEKHAISLERTGQKEIKVGIVMFEIVSGYEENENYFKKLKEEYERRRLKNETQIKNASFREF